MTENIVSLKSVSDDLIVGRKLEVVLECPAR